ncbi:hydantoinase/oxoprolinase family protein [Thermovibrio ammonificans]
MVPVGVDTGGTFTDFVFVEGGRLKVLKLLSTPDNPARAVIEGLKAIAPNRARRIIHGTTVATNALLERKGARTAFITNKGFEELLFIGRQNREKLYDPAAKKPEPLVERELCFGLNCRVNSKGEVVEPLKEEELQNLISKLKELQVQSAAVCFLFSFLNPRHELEVKAALERAGIPASVSSEIVPEFREFERASTTTVNAFVLPKVSGYIEHLERAIKPEDTLKIMQSNGGIISSATAKREPVRTVLSGPAGGVVGAWRVGKEAGFEKLITFDMGGTSTDVSLIDGRPAVTTEAKISGIPVKVPVIEIHTVGAGGGSIAWIDAGGALRVGPQSAGADPGPICYGRGEQITVTDANLFLGRLDPENFLGGGMRLYPERLKPFFEEMAKRLNIEPVELAEGIVEVANAQMERAVKVISVERGYDPQDFTLVSFGGAGGLHAAFLAQSLKIPRVLIPTNPGVLSAFGMISADVVKDFSKTVMVKAEEVEKVEEALSELQSRALKAMEEEGFSEGDVAVEKLVDARYKGQSFEITVPYCRNFKEKFEESHRKLFGYTHEAEVEVVTARVRAVGITEKPKLPAFEEGSENPPPGALLKEKPVYFKGEWIKTPVYSREELLPGNKITGPAVIVEYSATTVVPPGAKLKVDRFKNLIVEVNLD